MKIRLVDSLNVMQIINNTPTTRYLSPEESIGIVELRSLDFYNIKPQVIHFNLICAHNLFSKWNLDPRRNMTDEEILYKYIDLSKSHLTNKEKKRGNGSHSYLQESF